MPFDSPGPRPQDGPTSALRVVAVLLRWRRLVLAAPLVAALATLAVSAVVPRTYTVRASFVPQSLSQPDVSSLAGLSAQLGIGTLGSATAFGSPDFYKKLLETQTILGEIADTRFEFPQGNRRFTGTLSDFWGIGAPTPDRVRTLVVQRLRSRLGVRVDQRIQLTEVEATTTSPFLSKAIVDRALELVSQFNQERRQSQSAQEARFIGERLMEVRRSLTDAEDAVATFMQRNRDLRSSPALMFQYERLQREVASRQTVYAALSQRYEQSRIEEVRDTPVFTMVERAQLPSGPDSRRLALRMAVALLAGMLIGVFFALSAELLTRGRRTEEQDDLAALRQSLREIRADVRRPWRLFFGRPA